MLPLYSPPSTEMSTSPRLCINSSVCVCIVQLRSRAAYIRQHYVPLHPEVRTCSPRLKHYYQEYDAYRSVIVEVTTVYSVQWETGVLRRRSSPISGSNQVPMRPLSYACFGTKDTLPIEFQ